MEHFQDNVLESSPKHFTSQHYQRPIIDITKEVRLLAKIGEGNFKIAHTVVVNQGSRVSQLLLKTIAQDPSCIGKTVNNQLALISEKKNLIWVRRK